MRTRRAAMALAVGVGVVVCSMWLPAQGYAQDKPEVMDLLHVGKVGPEAIGFKAWTNRPQGEAFDPGDRVLIHFQAEKPGYVLVFHVSSSGNVTVLFPNKERPDNRIEAGKVYTLFGDDSQIRLKLGKKASQARVAFYVSPNPIQIDAIKTHKGRPWIRISADNTTELQVFRKELRKIADQKSFNRVVLALKSNSRQEHEVKLMGPTRLHRSPLRPIQKRLPGGIESDTPETITGTQGLKQNIRH